MPNQPGDEKSVKCGALNSRGEHCKAWAVRDSDPPLCTMHSMTAEERAAFTAKGGKVRARNVRIRHDTEERLDGLAVTVTTEQILEVCVEALSATFEHDGSPDWGARLSACAVLLQVFPKELRKSPAQATELLHGVLDGTRHARLAEIEVREHFHALRKEWFETVALRADTLGSLYFEAVPPMLYAPGETPASVQHEVPNLDQWKVERLRDERGHEIDSHVRVVKPDGTKLLVARDAFGERRGKALAMSA